MKRFIFLLCTVLLGCQLSASSTRVDRGAVLSTPDFKGLRKRLPNNVKAFITAILDRKKCVEEFCNIKNRLDNDCLVVSYPSAKALYKLWSDASEDDKQSVHNLIEAFEKYESSENSPRAEQALTEDALLSYYEFSQLVPTAQRQLWHRPNLLQMGSEKDFEMPYPEKLLGYLEAELEMYRLYKRDFTRAHQNPHAATEYLRALMKVELYIKQKNGFHRNIHVRLEETHANYKRFCSSIQGVYVGRHFEELAQVGSWLTFISGIFSQYTFEQYCLDRAGAHLWANFRNCPEREKEKFPFLSLGL